MTLYPLMEYDISVKNVTEFMVWTNSIELLCENIQLDSKYFHRWYTDELVQERHNSIANALELRLSCTNPSICVADPDV